MKENDPSSVLLFLVGTKRDLSVGETSPVPPCSSVKVKG